jgi:hypothetical protein
MCLEPKLFTVINFLMIHSKLRIKTLTVFKMSTFINCIYVFFSPHNGWLDGANGYFIIILMILY